jgi:hypothetical protein
MIREVCRTVARTRVRGFYFSSVACGSEEEGEVFLRPPSLAGALRAIAGAMSKIAPGKFLLSRFHKFQNGFVHLPLAELLLFCLSTPLQDAVVNSEAGPQGGGQDARSQREVAERKRHPAVALSGLPALRVREAGPGFSAGLLARSKRHRLPWRCPLRGLIVPASPPPRGPGTAARSCAQRQRPEQSEAQRDSAPSVSRYGAVWPPRGSCRQERLQHPRHDTACGSGGSNQAISLGCFP